MLELLSIKNKIMLIITLVLLIFVLSSKMSIANASYAADVPYMSDYFSQEALFETKTYKHFLPTCTHHNIAEL